MTQIALVTGGGSGIGRSIALHLNQKNCFVYVIGRRQDKLNETKSLSSHPENIKCVPGDLTLNTTKENLYSQIKMNLANLII